MDFMIILRTTFLVISAELPVLLFALDCTSTCLDGKAICIPVPQSEWINKPPAFISGKFVYGRPWYMYKYHRQAELTNLQCSKIEKCPSVKKCKEVSKDPCGCCDQCSKGEGELCGTHIGNCEAEFDCAPIRGLESNHPQRGICELPPLPPISPDELKTTMRERTTPSTIQLTLTPRKFSSTQLTVKPWFKKTTLPIITTSSPTTTCPPRPRRGPIGWGSFRRRILRGPPSASRQIIIGPTGKLGPAG